MRSRYWLTTALALVLLVVVANATAYAYRWLDGTVQVAPPNNAQGAACTGFYTERAEQADNPLPDLGTNYDAPTYGPNSITVTPGAVVCQYTHGGNTFNLYESISVTVPITSGTWWIKDFYAFGYYGNGYTDNVHVFIRVKNIISGVNFDAAELRLYKFPGGQYVGMIDLKNSGSSLYVMLASGEALRLDLWLDTAAGASGTANFALEFYVSQENEAP
ncbi:MAG: hypothetical protein NZ902_05215 [Acidilobaceae archaeon]|nr:hypothetical protein [Acidilobaceae archaeon]MDW7974609.1 hypothetical protein [Sulfolobales archaeon]